MFHMFFIQVSILLHHFSYRLKENKGKNMGTSIEIGLERWFLP